MVQYKINIHVILQCGLTVYILAYCKPIMLSQPRKVHSGLQGRSQDIITVVAS